MTGVVPLTDPTTPAINPPALSMPFLKSKSLNALVNIVCSIVDLAVEYDEDVEVEAGLEDADELVLVKIGNSMVCTSFVVLLFS